MIAREIEFSALDAGAHTYPPPHVPVLPFWSHRELVLNSEPPASRFLQDDAVFMRSGRVALATALQIAGLGAEDQVLFPAFHCGSMIEPAAWLGNAVDFYDLDPGLRVDLSRLVERLSAKTKAIVVTHYFGFPQDLAPIRALCDARGICLIEDCAHAFFGEHQGRLLGSTGHLAIASSVKFFPGTEGGVLVSNAGHSLPALRPAGAYRALKAARHLVELARRAERALAGAREPQSRVPDGPAPPPPSGWRWFKPEDVGQALDRTHQWVIRHSRYRQLMASRRHHYRLLAEGLAGLSHAKLLFPALPEGVIPYKLPLLIDRPEQQFPVLKRRGVPIWRWDEQVLTEAEVSRLYRLHLLQVPVHQSLRPQDLQWIIAQLREVLG